MKAECAGHIYAIGPANSSMLKIGSTQRGVFQRLQQLQTGHPETLMIMAETYIHRDLRRIERQVHRFLENRRRKGEWFETQLNSQQLESLVVKAVQYIKEEDARRAEEKKIRERTWLLRRPQVIQKDPSAQNLPTLGQELRRLRLAQRMTKQALAEKVRVSETALNSIERDIIESPRFFLVTDIAAALGISVDALVLVVDHPTRERTYVRQELITEGQGSDD